MRTALVKGFMNDSTKTFACGQSGFTLWWIIPFIFMKSLNSLLWKGGPLSEVIFSGRPCVANIFARDRLTACAVVLRMISTSGNLEYSSITTNSISPVGNGPQKSIWRKRQGWVGSSDIWTGVGDIAGPVAWQARQSTIRFSASLSIPGHHTLERSSCFVFTIP